MKPDSDPKLLRRDSPENPEKPTDYLQNCKFTKVKMTESGFQ